MKLIRIRAVRDGEIGRIAEIARDEIFGTLRDAYDGKITKRFANGIVRAYQSTFGLVAGVTPAIESFVVTHAMLGE